MGHRTLVAYDRHGYDLHYAHWGVDPDDLTAEARYGHPPDDEWVRDRAADVLDPSGGYLTDDHETAVDPEPLATGLTFAEVCARVDLLEHEALYVVDSEYDVRRYLVVALRTGEDRRRTALVGYDDPVDAVYLRGWLAGARAVRAVTGGAADADLTGRNPVVAALRWLDAARGTIIYPAADPSG